MGTSGDTAMVTFEVSTPTISTRTVGDGNTAKKLYVGVYEYQNGTLGDTLEVSLIKDNEVVTFTERKATVNLALAKNKKYSVIFWAETENNGEAMFDIDWNDRELNLKSSLKANQEKYDAFWAQKDVNLNNGNISEKVELKRPFAQLNIGTSDKDDAKAAGIIVDRTEVKTKVFTTFNLQDGIADDEAEVTYKMEAIKDIKDQAFPVAKQSYLSLNYLLMNADKSIVDVTFSYMDEEDDNAYELKFTSVPVQRNYRTNIYGTLLTNSANYTVEILPGFGDEGEEDVANIKYVSTNEDLKKALASNEGNIIINLMPTEHKAAATRAAGDATVYTIEINGVDTYLGGENTDSITINANGCTINFNYTNGDSQYIHCVNSNAKLIINDAHLTNSGKNNGPWNRHNICFFDAVELNNVTSDKAIALLNDSKLTGVSISDVHPDNSEAYGLWISARGQQVELDGCEIIAHSTKTGDRGITINDQYVGDALGKVTLIVKNTKIETQKKAAILVKSDAGADIQLENVDLSGVKADGFNAVWVDTDRNNIDKVSVNGGFVIVEGAAENETNPFLVENATVKLPAGTFVMPAKVANGVTIEGATDGTTILDMTGANPAQITGLTFKNVTINVGNEIYHGMTHTSGLTYENCVINGTLFLYSTAVFNNCTFNVEGDNYNVWTYGSTEAIFNTCTFNCDGKSVLVYNEGGNGSVITMNQCQFFASAAVEGKAAVEIDSSLLPEGMTYVVNLNECTAEGFGKGSVSNEMLFNHKRGTKASIYVDGYKTVSTEEELKAAINAANNTEFTKIALTSKTFTGAFDIAGKSVELVALNNHQATIDGLVHGLDYAHITLKNLVLTNATPATSTSARHNADGYCLGAYVADILIEDCIFNVKSTGKGAINIYANRSDYEQYDGFDLTVMNSTFNCNGERPIRGKTNSWIEGCTFNDQHRYAIQVQGNEELASETVKFINNTIVNPCKTSGEAFAAGVSISGSQLLENAAFFIEGNILESNKFDNLKFVYDLKDNVKITTCTLNDKAIVEGQLEAIEGVDDAKEVLDEVQYTWDATTRTFTAYTAKGLKKANEMMVDKSMGRDATLVLGANIDFSGYTWKTVDSHADTAFEIKEIDGRDHTLSNLTVSGTAMFSRFAGFEDVVIKDITFDNAIINSGNMNTAIIVGQSYQNVLLDNVDVKNSSVTGTYKVAPFIATVYNENPSTITATLKNCDVNGVNVKCTSFDFCTAGMVAFVYEGNNDKVEFENCTIKNLHLSARPNGYASHAWIYVNDAETDDTFNSAEGVTVDESTCTFTRL